MQLSKQTKEIPAQGQNVIPFRLQYSKYPYKIDISNIEDYSIQ